MLQGFSALYGLSGRLSFGRFCLVLLADAAIGSGLFGVGALLQHVNLVAGITLSLAALLLLAWGLLSAVVRLGRTLLAPQPARCHDETEVPDGQDRAGARAAARAKGQSMGVVPWAVILGLFAGALWIGPGRIGQLFWPLFAPPPITVDIQGNEKLADQAVTDPRALQTLLTRAKAGDPSAMFFYATFFDPEGGSCRTAAYQPKDAAVAVYWYKKAAALNDQGADRMLGIDYYYGSGVPQDYAKSAQLLERDVSRNDEWAEYYLGLMLEKGQGGPANPARAALLEQKSADQGLSLAQTELGSMYFSGNGVAQSRQKAAYYWGLAAAQGDATAQTLLTLLTQNGMAQ